MQAQNFLHLFSGSRCLYIHGEELGRRASDVLEASVDKGPGWCVTRCWWEPFAYY